MENNWDEENKQEKQERHFADYTSPEPGSYNLNGTYYQSSQHYTSEDTYSYTYGNGSDFSSQSQPAAEMGKQQDRPLRNRFGMKLTFSIVGIVMGLLLMCVNLVLGGLSLAVSIVALVFTCLQNNRFQAGNWQSFRHYAKISAIFLWIDLGLWVVYLILFIIVIVFAVAMGNTFFDGIKESEPYSVSSEIEEIFSDETEKEENTGSLFHSTEGAYVPMVKGFNQFELQEAEISLPMDMSDIYKAGFHLREDDESGVLEPGDSYGYGYYDSNDNYLGTLFIYNTTEKKIHAKDGIAGGITINGGTEVSLRMVGGLSFTSSREEAASVLGSNVTYMTEDDSDSYYSWYFEDGGYYTSMELDFDGNTMREVWIMNDQQLRQ